MLSRKILFVVVPTDSSVKAARPTLNLGGGGGSVGKLGGLCSIREFSFSQAEFSSSELRQALP
ncbi:hypothetical protein [Leptospira adleri]|uniref:hypothetical protein n=1 Tax=Leptospira adleri TaxID=2023186 RepID=UPI0010834474|nr:hypothetical protein [Leptospira adleri]TGM56993.1 hypothetical protein EHQ97_10695 [Leptospira adleri]